MLHWCLFCTGYKLYIIKGEIPFENVPNNCIYFSYLFFVGMYTSLHRKTYVRRSIYTVFVFGDSKTRRRPNPERDLFLRWQFVWERVNKRRADSLDRKRRRQGEKTQNKIFCLVRLEWKRGEKQKPRFFSN